MSSAPADRRVAWGRFVGSALLIVHAGLLAWAVIGLIEWLAPSVPWARLSNPLFPDWLLLLHWLAILAAAVVFLGGYLTRWSRTPYAVAAAYSAMALVCAVETVGYMNHELRFVAMAGEYLVYLLIVYALFRMPGLSGRFSSASTAPVTSADSRPPDRV